RRAPDDLRPDVRLRLRCDREQQKSNPHTRHTDLTANPSGRWNSSRMDGRSRMPMMPIRERVDALLARLASEPQFPTQGETLFVDLGRAEVHRAYIPRRVVELRLGGEPRK